MKRCPRCKHPMSEWFVWQGFLHCLVCCIEFKWLWTVLEDGRKVRFR